MLVPATLERGGAAPGGSGGGIGGACSSRWNVLAVRLPSAEDVRRMAEAEEDAGDAPLPTPPRPAAALELGTGEGVGVTELLTLPELELPPPDPPPPPPPLKTGIAIGIDDGGLGPFLVRYCEYRLEDCGMAADMDLRASSLLWTGTGRDEGLGAAGKCGGVGACA